MLNCGGDQHEKTNWLLIDGFSEPGGLARTESTPEGFLFDMGGHVIYSHYQYFDQLLDRAMGSGPEAWNTIERVSYIWIKDRCAFCALNVVEPSFVLSKIVLGSGWTLPFSRS